MPTLDELRQQRGIPEPVTLDSLRERREAALNENFFVKAYKYATGEGRTEGYPELGTSGESVPVFKAGQGSITNPETGEERKFVGSMPFHLNPPATKMATAYATQVDPKAIADIAVKALSDVDPEVKQGKDKFGNPTLTFEGKTYYINAPGFSEADAFQTLGQIGAFAPAAKAGAVARTFIKRMLTTGLLSTTTSVALDVAGQAMGSKQDIDWVRAGISGAIGGAMEGLAPALKYGWRTLFSKGPKYFNPATGQLTKEGVRIAREAGLDPVDMDRRLAVAFARQATDEPVPALAKTRAYEEAYGIPYTRGQQLAQTGDFRQSAVEEGMRHGLRGEAAERGMKGVDRRFAAQTESAIDPAVGRTTRPVQETGEEILAGVQKAEATKRAARGAAYEAAEPFITTARITRDNFSGLMKNVKQGVKDLGIDPVSHPKTVLTLRRLGRVFKKAKKGDKLDITEVTLKRVETERKLINRHLRGKMENTDRHALLEAQSAMDDWLSKAYDDALMSGDPQALKVLKKARKEAHEYYSLFTKQNRRVNDEVGTVIEKLLYADATPEMAVNYVFGTGKLGKKLVAAKTIKRLKSILGDGSDEFNALKDVAWRKLKTGGNRQIDDPLAYVTNFDDLYSNNRSLLDELYTPDEVNMMKSVRDAIDAMDVVSSESRRRRAGVILRSLQRVFHWRGTAQAVMHRRPLYGSLLHIIGRNLPFIGGGIQEASVKRAATQIPRPLPASPPTVAAAIAGSRLGGEQ